MRGGMGESGLPVLILSHCVPDASGDAAQRRAWQLLTLFGPTHEVWLACSAADRVHWQQWRKLRAHAAQVAIEPLPWSRRLLAGTRKLLRIPRQAGTATARLQLPTVCEWVARQRFDVVICTQRVLWAQTQRIAARKKICDGPGPDGQQATTSIDVRNLLAEVKAAPTGRPIASEPREPLARAA
jgi:hypothetical protein